MTNTDFTARCMAGKALEDVAGKQDVIADLDTIRAGAAAGATAVQPAALEDYQPKIDSTHKLDADLVDDTNSTNKFATATQLSQIETNKNNILLLEQLNGAKNQINIPNGTYVAGTSSFSVSGGAVTSTATDNNTHAVDLSVWTLKAGTYVFFDDSSDLSAVQYRIYQQSPDTRLTPAGQNPATFTIANDTVVYLSCYTFKTGTMTTHPMLVPKTIWDAGFTDYQPYALPNTELTALEKQNDNNIVLLSQYGGGINKLDCSLPKLKNLNSSSWTWNGNVATIGSQTITVNSNKTLTVHTTNEHGQLSFMLTTLATNQGNLFVSGCPSGGDASTYKIGISNVGYDIGNGKVVPNQTTARQVFIEISANVAIDLTFKPMIIEQSIHDSGFNGFQPYAKTNVELTEQKFNRNIANSSKTYTLENNNQYIITVNSYGAYGVFMAFKYSDEATPRLYEIKKSSSFDSLITITAVTDSNDITIAPVSSSTWFVSGGFKVT